MVVSTEAKERGSPVVVVYIRCTRPEMWYRLEFPTPTKEELVPRETDQQRFPQASKIYPVAELYGESVGMIGGWDVIGDDIYWIGGRIKTVGDEAVSHRSLCKSLRKHNITWDDRREWVDASPPMNIPRPGPVVASINVDKRQQLCVVGGWDSVSSVDFPDDEDIIWSKCGEIYDLNTKTWTTLDAHYDYFRDYIFRNSAQDVEDPTRLVFFSTSEGFMFFLDATSRKIDIPPSQPNFGLSLSKNPTPQGLRDELEVSMLLILTHSVTAVFAKDTLYWCSPDDICLYGYDMERQRWLRSRSLMDQFPSVYYRRDEPIFPMLLGVPGGKFVLIVAGEDAGEDAGEGRLFTMAFLKVDKGRGNCLRVSVDLVQRFYFDNPSFHPLDGKALCLEEKIKEQCSQKRKFEDSSLTTPIPATLATAHDIISAETAAAPVSQPPLQKQSKIG